MANVEVHGVPGPRQKTVARETTTGGSAAEALAGAAAFVLGILGLADLLPLTLASIAMIAVGAALLLEGGTVFARASRLDTRTTERAFPEVTGGVTAEGFAGIAAVALGILALLRIDPFILLPVAAIVVGAALILGGAAMARAHTPGFASAVLGEEPIVRVAQESIYAESGAQALVGIAAVVLGILALTGGEPLVLTLTAVLVLGASILLNGVALSMRTTASIRR